MTDSLHRLLEIQDLDIAADQLRHRRATLPERAQMATANAAIANHEAGIVEFQDRRLAHLTSQRKVEDELEALAARAAAEEAKLYGGGVTALRELQALQSELEAVRRRQGQLEDEALADMESVEELSLLIAEEEREVAGREREVIQLIGVIGAAEAAIDSELATTAAGREALADGLSADLLATYERLRARLDGVAVARLEGGHCLGCHLALPATEVDAVRRAPEGAFVTHEGCGRILVR
jgi:predicted  nucleic acid-binding Zn-ribbon protein